MDKVTIAFVIILAGILAVCLVSGNNFSDDSSKTTLKVYSEGPVELSELINEIKTKEYYRGFDNETVSWMESLGNKYVWVSDDEIIIMDWWDSNKIPSVGVCDGYGIEIFSCSVLENRSLGNGNDFKDVLLVNNVEYLREEIHGNGLA